MKVETQKAKFQPVVITLESQEELDQMYALAAAFEFSTDKDITMALYENLKTVVDVEYELVGNTFHK